MNYFSIHFNISCGHLRWLFQKGSLKKNSWPHKLPASAREKQEYGLARVILFQRDLLADTLIKKSHVLLPFSQETKINCSFHHWDILLKFSCEMYVCSLKFEHAGLSFWPYFSSLFSQDHQGVGTSHLDFFFFFERWLTEVLTKPIRTLPCEIRIM